MPAFLPVGLAVVVSVTAACDEKDPEIASRSPFSRGDTVVVERSAAEFFQARVLAVDDRALRVQTADEGDPVKVAIGDAYPISGRASTLRPSDLAVCNVRGTQWIGCRIERIDRGNAVVRDERNQSYELGRGRILLPTEVTRINLERAFELAEKRAAFRRAIFAAGGPPRRPGWAPAVGERVLARHEDNWFSARVIDVGDAGSLLVSWDGEPGSVVRATQDLALPPPYHHRFAPGQFALLEPPTPGQAWRPVRVRSVGEGDVTVEGERGASDSVSARSLVPLVSSAPESPPDEL